MYSPCCSSDTWLLTQRSVDRNSLWDQCRELNSYERPHIQYRLNEDFGLNLGDVCASAAYWLSWHNTLIYGMLHKWISHRFRTQQPTMCIWISYQNLMLNHLNVSEILNIESKLTCWPLFLRIILSSSIFRQHSLCYVKIALKTDRATKKNVR